MKPPEGPRVLGFREFKVLGFRVWGSGFKGLRFRVQVFGVSASGFGFTRVALILHVKPSDMANLCQNRIRPTSSRPSER